LPETAWEEETDLSRSPPGKQRGGDDKLKSGKGLGLETDGEVMDWDMLRWNLSGENAKDQLEHLKMP